MPFILLSVRSTLFTLLHSAKIPFYRQRGLCTSAGDEWPRLGRCLGRDGEQGKVFVSITKETNAANKF